MALFQKNPVAPQRIFAAAKKETTLELLVYDSIGASYWGDGVTAKRVKAQLDAAGDVSKIIVRLNSPGGDVFEGSAIYSLLTQHKAEVECYVDGLAASAAFTIAMAGKKIHVSEAGMMMCHNAWGMCMGDSKEMRATADILDKVSGTMRDIYSSRSGKSADDMQALMDAESWFTAQECVDNGFADDVVKREPDEDEESKALAASFDLSKFRHAPKGEAKTKTVDGKDCTKSDFAYQGSDKLEDWKLPISCPGNDEEWEKNHIRNAISRWNQTDMPNAEEKSKARGRIKSAAKKYDIDVDEDSLKDSVEANENCMCDCPECQAGDCADCSDPDCDDPNCEGHDDDTENKAKVELMRQQFAF